MNVVKKKKPKSSVMIVLSYNLLSRLNLKAQADPRQIKPQRHELLCPALKGNIGFYLLICLLLCYNLKSVQSQYLRFIST